MSGSHLEANTAQHEPQCNSSSEETGENEFIDDRRGLPAHRMSLEGGANLTDHGEQRFIGTAVLQSAGESAPQFLAVVVRERGIVGGADDDVDIFGIVADHDIDAVHGGFAGGFWACSLRMRLTCRVHRKRNSFRSCGDADLTVSTKRLRS